MEKLYELSNTNDKEKQDLYTHKRSNKLDFMTYFNSFSLKKWVRYTTIQTVSLKLQLLGKWKIIWKLVDESKEKILLEEICDTAVYQHEFPIEELSGIILGFELEPLTKDAEFQSGAWYGTFVKWEDKQIGISICTFKREEYVKRTISLLREFQRTHSWLSVLVVDNGSTLQEIEQERFCIVHNPNYGGSGGFARGMIEYVNEGKVNYVLLMDDDIILDTTALVRTHSLLCGLKDEYQDSFLSGAMLRIEEPTIQHENTARWGKIRLHAFGANFDLTKVSTLVANEQSLAQKNRYGAWWYCCIPRKRIEQLGYPLPVFVRGDDMEYGMRNQKETIHMNGIGVWHQSFQKKYSRVVNYYDDRNMLIINNYAEGCGWLEFATVVCGRIVKRLMHRDLSGMNIFYQALCDYNRGFEGMTQIPADQKMQEIIGKVNQNVSWNVVPALLGVALKGIFCYWQNNRKYLKFRERNLKDNIFWKTFLKRGM